MMRIALAALLAGLIAATQTSSKSSFIGTVSEVADGRLVVTPDGLQPVAVNLKPESLIQRIAPGEKDLKNAQTITLTDVSRGDRVLVNLFPDRQDVRRIVVMSSDDIKKRDEVERMDWSRRGVSGVVVSKSGNQIILRTRSFAGEQHATVTLDGRTRFKRYAPDSVAFKDAKNSSPGEIQAGDQLRARGRKSENGLQIEAEEVVFGTFLTKAGTVKSVDNATREITVEDLETKKPLMVQVAADSQLKKMPDFAGAMGGPPTGMPPNGMPPGGQAGPRAGGGPDISQMLERMPAATLEDVKPGQTIIVSSTKGARNDHLTAIMLVVNAGFLIRMAAMQRGAGGQESIPAGVGGLSGMMTGFELPGMVP